MKISYNEATSMECPDSSLEKDIMECRKAGFSHLELRFDKIDAYLEQHDAGELKELLQQNSITPVAYNAVYIYPELFTEQDDSARQQEVVRRMKLAAYLADIIGARKVIVVVPLLPSGEKGPYQAEWRWMKDHCVRILLRLSDFSKPYGLKLCVEPVGHNKSGVRTIAQTREIVEAVDRKNVGYALDAYNIFQYDKSNDFSQLAELPEEKIFAVHINNADDVPLSQVSQLDRRFCDSGVIDLQAYLNAIRKTGYQGTVSIEVVRPEYWEKDTAWVIREAYRTTKEVLEPYLS